MPDPSDAARLERTADHAVSTDRQGNLRCRCGWRPKSTDPYTIAGEVIDHLEQGEADADPEG